MVGCRGICLGGGTGFREIGVLDPLMGFLGWVAPVPSLPPRGAPRLVAGSLLLRFGSGGFRGWLARGGRPLGRFAGVGVGVALGGRAFRTREVPSRGVCLRSLCSGGFVVSFCS